MFCTKLKDIYTATLQDGLIVDKTDINDCMNTLCTLLLYDISSFIKVPISFISLIFIGMHQMLNNINPFAVKDDNCYCIF